MEVIIFDIKGSFAHFRAYDTTRENMSYPFPPKTAVIGLIAGILGYQRNIYWRESPLKEALISIQILNPIIRSKFRVNYLQQRNTITLSNDIKLLIAKDPYEVKSKDQRGYYAPVNLNVLRNVKYRIFFHCADEAIMNELELRLKENKYCYPPYLGHANMLAEIIFVGRNLLANLESGIYNVDTIIPVSALDVERIDLDSLGFSILFNIPSKLGVTKNNLLYLVGSKNLILNENYNKEGLKAHFKTDMVKETKIFEKTQKIVLW